MVGIAQCLSVVATLFMLASYEFTAPTTSVLSNTWVSAMTGISIRNIRINKVTFPQDMNVSYDSSGMYISLGECVTLTGITDVKAIFIPLTNQPTDMVICGGLNYTRQMSTSSPVSPDTCASAVSLAPGGLSCTMTAVTTVHTSLMSQSVNMDLCTEFLDVVAIEQLLVAATAAPALGADGTAVADVKLFRLAKQLLGYVESALGFEVALTFPDATGLHVHVAQIDALDVDGLMLPVADVGSMLAMLPATGMEAYTALVRAFLKPKSNAKFQVMLGNLLNSATLKNGPFALNMTADMSLPAGMTADVDVFLGGLQCAAESADGSGAYNCQFPLSGLKVANVELSHLLDVNTLVPQAAMVLVNAFVGPILTDNLSACEAASGVCYITHDAAAPAAVYPVLSEGGTAAQDTALLSLIAGAVNSFASVFGIVPHVDFVADTAMRVRLDIPAAIDLAPVYDWLRRENVTGRVSDVLHTTESLATVAGLLDTVKLTTDVVTILQDVFPSIAAGASAEVVLVFNDLKCAADTGMDCTFPIAGGLTVDSVDVSGFSDIDYIVGQWADVLLPFANALLSSLLLSRVCDTTSGLCTTMSTSVAATAYPELAAGATAVSDAALLALLSDVAGGVESLFNVSVGAAPVADAATAYDVSVSTVDAVNVAGLLSVFGVDMSTMSLSALVSSLLANDAQALSIAQMLLSNVKLTDSAAQAIGGFIADVPAGLSASVALVFSDLKCAADTGMDCTFPIAGGLGVANLAVTTPSTAVDVLVANVQGVASSAVNALLSSLLLSRVCDTTSGLCTTMSTATPTPRAAPALVAGALPTSRSSIFQVLATAAMAIDNVAGVTPTFTLPSNTSVRAGVQTSSAVDVEGLVSTLDAALGLVSSGVTVEAIVNATLAAYSADISLLASNVKLSDSTAVALKSLTESLPKGLAAHADVFFADLRCDAVSGTNCSLPASVGGVELANVLLATTNVVVDTLVQNVQTLALPLVNKLLPSVLSLVLTLDSSSDRFTFTVPLLGAAANASNSPALRSGATPMVDVGIARALVNAGNALAHVGALNLHLSTFTNTTLLISADIGERIDVAALLSSESMRVVLDIGKKYIPALAGLETLLASLSSMTWSGAMGSLSDAIRAREAAMAGTRADVAKSAARVASTLADDGSSALTTLMNLLGLVQFTNTTIDPMLDLIGNIVSGTAVNIGVSIDDLTCTEGGFSCSFPTFAGLRLADLTSNGISLVDSVLAPVLPMARSLVNDNIDPVLASLTTYCGNLTDGRCSILLKNEKVVKVPHVSFFIAFPILAVVAIVVLVGQNVIRRKHRIIRLLPSAKDECYESDGAPISVAHIVIEDTIVCVVAMFLLSCFVMAHFSTLAYLIIGNEWTLYLFALHTVAHLWTCKLQALSTFIVVFSGVLVYAKLVVLIVFSMVLHRPRCLVVRIFEVIGGFSMVLVYVLLCFYSFMQTPGVIEVRVRPSFYLFMGGVFGSFLLGHYITYFWRFGTNIRDKPFSFDDFKAHAERSAVGPASPSSESHEPLDADPALEDSDVIQDELHNPDTEGVVKPTEADQAVAMMDKDLLGGSTRSVPQRVLNWVREFFAHGVWWPASVPFFIVIGATLLPGWLATCITYRVGGVASVAITNVRTFTLMQQSSALGEAAATGLVMTGAVMPLVYSLFYNGIPSAAGWSTAFVVFMTSTAGLIHINRFVQYVLAGPAGGMDDFYNGHATIEWPLWLQCAPGVLVYVAVVCDFLGVRRVLSARCRCGREYKRQHAKDENYPIK